MKRDPELVRKILLEIEKSEEPQFAKVEIAGYSDQQLMYHIQLLYEAGYIAASDDSSMGGNLSFIVERLTWTGHDFLDAARDDTVWNKTKTTLGEKVGSVSFDLLKELLVQTARAMFMPGP